MRTHKTNQNYILPIIMMFLLFFIISFVTGLQNPMAGILKDQFALSNFQSQLANMAVFLAYLFMGIPAGKMLESIGYKKTALTSLVIGFTGVLIMYFAGKTSSFSLYLSGAFVSGFSMCLLNTVVNPMLCVLGTEEGANQRLNFGGALNSLGATFAPILGGMVVGQLSKAKISDANPLLFLAMAIFALVFIVLFSVKIPEPHLKIRNKDKSPKQYSPLSFRHFRYGMAAVFIYVGVEVAIANVTLAYLTKGLTYEPAVAGTIVGTYWFFMLVGRLLGGVLGKTFTSKQMLTAVAVVGIILVVLSIMLGTDIKVQMPTITSQLSLQITEVPLSIMLLILCGLCTSVMWPVIFNLATAGLGKYTAEGSGYFMMMVFGGGILPLLQAKIADNMGFPVSYWVIVLALAYILFFALIGSKNVNKNIKTS